MKTLIYIFSLLVFPAISQAQNERMKAAAQTLISTFNIQGDKFTGTCFMVVKEGEQYFVTAAHLFESSHKSGDRVSIQMFVQNEWKSFDAKLYFHEDRNVDVVLVVLTEKISQIIQLPEGFLKSGKSAEKLSLDNGISLDTTFISLGMDVFFYGFPLGNLGTEALGIKFPLVKKAIVSGWVKYNKIDVLVLDGHNNIGFSGGPVVAYDSSSKIYCVVGVVSGYVPEPINLKYKGDNVAINQNSGIIVCYERSYIEEIFRKNKKGL